MTALKTALSNRRARRRAALSDWRAGWTADLDAPGARKAARYDMDILDHGLLRRLWTNRHEIAPGIWRSNQPSPEQVADLAAMGIRTIVNFRGRNQWGSYLLAETGEAALTESLEWVWRNVTRRKLYLTGAIGAYHNGVSSRGDMVHEAFGRDYELPSATAYNETCANIGNAMWARRLLALTGKAEYADEMERVLYNSALSPMDLDGSRFCYCNPLARLGPEVRLLNHDTPERWRTHTCYCCPPQVARTLAGLHEWAFGWDDGSLWVHLYGSSCVDMELPGRDRLALDIQTDYPWNGTVRLRVDQAPAAEFALRLRVPGWASGATVAVNGGLAEDAIAGEYVVLRRQWQPGDTVTLELPLRVRLMVANPNVEETRNQVAVMRGPLVYCLEAADLPGDVPIHELSLPRDAAWTVRHEPALLGGVTVLQTEAWRRPGPDWADCLYAELPTTSGEPEPIRLIPYYAWLNRGNCQMRVWLPLGWRGGMATFLSSPSRFAIAGAGCRGIVRGHPASGGKRRSVAT